MTSHTVTQSYEMRTERLDSQCHKEHNILYIIAHIKLCITDVRQHSLTSQDNIVIM